MLRGLLLGESTFHSEAFARAAPEAVRAVLADPERWIRLQPLVIEVEPDPSAPGFFHITDRLRVAGFPVVTRYRARIGEVADGALDSEAWSSPFIHVENRLRWAAEGEGTRVREASTITAPRPLLGFTVRTARPAHVRMVEAIAAAAEGLAPRRG
jgi:hypothetical protein